MIGFRELLVILVIALVVFGAKRLRTIGTDLGSAVKGFKDSMKEGESQEQEKQLTATASSTDADFDSTPASKSGSKSSNA